MNYIATDMVPSELNLNESDTLEVKIEKVSKFLDEKSLTPVKDFIFTIRCSDNDYDDYKNTLVIYTDTKWDYHIREIINAYRYQAFFGETGKELYFFEEETVEEIRTILETVSKERGWSYWTGQKS